MDIEAMFTYHFNILLTAETPCQPGAEPDECDNTTRSYSTILCDNTTRGCGANLSRYKIPLIPIAERKKWIQISLQFYWNLMLVMDHFEWNFYFLADDEKFTEVLKFSSEDFECPLLRILL